MSFEIKTSSGHTIKSQAGALKIFESGLDDLLRPLETEIKMALVPILKNTKKNWLYNHRRSESNKSKPHSRDQFFIKSKKIISGGNLGLQVSINNNSQYAYMIRASTKFQSETKDNRSVPISKGANAFQKLLFDPMKKQAQNVAEKMANEYIKIVRMVG